MLDAVVISVLGTPGPNSGYIRQHVDMFVGRAVHGNRGHRQWILLRSFLQRHHRRGLWADTFGCGLHVGAGRTGFDRWWRDNHYNHHYNNDHPEHDHYNVDAYTNHYNVDAYTNHYNVDAYTNHYNVDAYTNHHNVDAYTNHHNGHHSDSVRPLRSSGSIGARGSRQGRRRQLG
jgi:hypothetical protein